MTSTTPGAGTPPPSTTAQKPAPKPRPKSMPAEAKGLENHPTANPNFRGRDPAAKAPPKSA